MGMREKFRRIFFKRAGERRKYPRVPLTVKVTKMTSGAFQFYKASNISAGGVFIKTVEPLPPGTRLRVKVSLPGGEIEADGEVVRVMLDGKHPSGMGVQFIDLTPADKEMIEEYVAKEM